MKGLGKFLFGGFLGALVGFLISPRRGQRVRDALVGRGRPLAAPPSPRLAAAPGPVVAPAPVTPVEPVTPAEAFSQVVAVPEEAEVPQEAQVSEEVEVPEEAEVPQEAQVSEEVEAEPAIVAEPDDAAVSEVVVPPAIAPETEIAPLIEPVVEAEVAPSVEPEPEAGPTIAEAPAAVFEEAVVPQWETPAVDEGPLAVVAAEVLEEPIVGPGWAAPEPDSSGVLVEEVPGAEEETIGPGSEGPADLKSRIEETRRRIQRELDHPFGGEKQVPDDWGSQDVVDATSPFDLSAGIPADEKEESPAELASLVKEGSFASPASPSEAESESPEQEPPGAAAMTPWGEQEPVEIVDTSASPWQATESALEVPAMSEDAEALAASLVEETPPGTAPAVSEPDTPWDTPVPVAEIPAIEVPVAEVPVDEVAVVMHPPAAFEEAAHAAPPADSPLTEDVDRLIRDEASSEVAAPPVESPATLGEFDHEAMRRRIEETRNRLKAKAFDAMMSGETALLGRDTEEAKRSATQTGVQVDTEVAETIESTLTEDDF